MLGFVFVCFGVSEVVDGGSGYRGSVVVVEGGGLFSGFCFDFVVADDSLGFVVVFVEVPPE